MASGSCLERGVEGLVADGAVGIADVAAVFVDVAMRCGCRRRSGGSLGPWP